MNFVGHAVVAAREEPEPSFCFGAMVPDLRRFTGRAPLELTERMSGGVASHHRVDAAFHDHPTFRAWMAIVVDRMPAPDRGARAAAHVAVELAIDGELLRRGDAGPYHDGLAWATEALDGPWRDVVERMASGAIVDGYRHAPGIAHRVVSVMSRRPRLARLGVDEAALTTAVAAVQPTIAADLDALLSVLA